MRYCPNCKKKVGTRLTFGQVIILLILLSFGLLPGILYGLLHARKCPICGCPTEAIDSDED